MQGSRSTRVPRGPRRGALSGAGVTAGALLVGALLPSQAVAGFLTPDSPVSPPAEDTRTAYIVMLIVAALLALVLIGALLAALRGRRPKKAEQRTRGSGAIQARVTLGLTALAAAVLVFGILLTESATDIPAAAAEAADAEDGTDSDGLHIIVSGQQWLWRYEYPDGTFSYHEMVVPVDTDVVLDITSVDVRHRWWVPALGRMVDAVPGQDNRTWFRAEETSSYEGRSTVFSGPTYAAMRARVEVVEREQFEQWLSSQGDGIAAAREAVSAAVEAGNEPESGSEGAGEGESPEAGGGSQ